MMNTTAAEKEKRTLYQKIKLIVVLAVVAVAVIIFFQNTESVQTRLLFITIEMPRIVALLGAMGVGFLLGTMFGKRVLLGKRR